MIFEYNVFVSIYSRRGTPLRPPTHFPLSGTAVQKSPRQPQMGSPPPPRSSGNLLTPTPGTRKGLPMETHLNAPDNHPPFPREVQERARQGCQPPSKRRTPKKTGGPVFLGVLNMAHPLLEFWRGPPLERKVQEVSAQGAQKLC